MLKTRESGSFLRQGDAPLEVGEDFVFRRTLEGLS